MSWPPSIGAHAAMQPVQWDWRLPVSVDDMSPSVSPVRRATWLAYPMSGSTAVACLLTYIHPYIHPTIATHICPAES